MDGTTCA